MLKSNDSPLTRSRLAYECCVFVSLTDMRRDRRQGAPVRRSLLSEGWLLGYDCLTVKRAARSSS